MKTRRTGVRAVAVFLVGACRTSGEAIAPADQAKTSRKAATPESLPTQRYIAPSSKDVRSEKADPMGAALRRDAGEAAKFWPVCKDSRAPTEAGIRTSTSPDLRHPGKLAHRLERIRSQQIHGKLRDESHGGG
jgi:hypothetical protein